MSASRQPDDGAPSCFLHVPKCAGTSVHVAFEAALPAEAIAPRRGDTAVFGEFSDFDALGAAARALVAVDGAEVAAMAGYRLVSGHFALPTLLSIAPPRNVATVLREPRARVLSTFMFLRLTRVVEFWGPYGRDHLARPGRSLEAFLSDPVVAHATDNQICRLLLHGDVRLRDGRFSDPAAAAELAAMAVTRLDELGYVGILEHDDVWAGMSRFLGVALAPVRTNVSGEGELPAGALPLPRLDMRTALDLIEARNAADRIVYETLLARRVGDVSEARRAADAAFAAELVRFGDMTGTMATNAYLRAGGTAWDRQAS